MASERTPRFALPNLTRTLGQLEAVGVVRMKSVNHRKIPTAAVRWLEDRQADLLPVPYYHIVFTLPAPISAIANYNLELISIVEDEKSVNKRTEKKFAASRRASL